ncbi:MAG: cytochrome c-type biogenesis protein CcmH, partial [Chloroflexi bacterium]|nr:cytochrome c-type biogenesis protein CcmH [Chloroflexota bacterium]
LLLGLTLPAIAQDGSEDDNGLKKAVTDDDVNKIARVVYCPVCESTPLDVCQTQACADWRQIIREMLEEGKSEQEVKGYFLNLYGPKVLAEPPREGFSLLVWALPLVLIPLGVVFFTRYMRNLRMAEADAVVEETAVPPQKPGDNYISQIERELEGK